MHRSWIYISVSFLSSCSIVHAFSFSNSTAVSYTDHCSSTVPQSIPTNSTSRNFIPRFVTPHFTGGESLLRRKILNHANNYIGKSLLLELQPKFYRTDANGIFKVEASLYILYEDPHYYAHRYAGSYYKDSRVEKAITFFLEGFWSQISGNLCMVGSAYLEVEGGRLINLDAVLKLNYAGEENPTVYTSVVSGILESTLSAYDDDPGYFDPILIYSFPVFPNYTYSLFPKEDFLNDRIFPKDRSLSLESTTFCSVVAAEQAFLKLEYAIECREAWHCSPLDSGLCDFLPPFLSLISLQCSERERKVRYLAKYRDDMTYSRTFRHDWTLIVEASWDYETHQLFGFGCRILNPAEHLLGNAVRDCTTRVSWRYPSILNIRNEATIIGQIWSSKSVEDSGYFRKIDLTDTDAYRLVDLKGFRYEYTELDRARKSCNTTKSGMNGETFPDGESYAMSTTFYFSVKGQRCGWGSAAPIFIGSKIFEVDHTAPTWLDPKMPL